MLQNKIIKFPNRVDQKQSLALLKKLIIERKIISVGIYVEIKSPIEDDRVLKDLKLFPETFHCPDNDHFSFVVKGDILWRYNFEYDNERQQWLQWHDNNTKKTAWILLFDHLFCTK